MAPGKWTVRRAASGMVLGQVRSQQIKFHLPGESDLEHALLFAREWYRLHDITVDDGPPTKPKKGVIRYL